MSDWIPFGEGEYLVESAFLAAPDGSAAALENTVVEVYLDRQGQRHLRGYSRIRSMLMVELLEDNDDLDLLLDFGEEFKYCLKQPEIQSGKVFSADTKSTFRFTPTIAWQQIPQDEFEKRLSRLKLLTE